MLPVAWELEKRYSPVAGSYDQCKEEYSQCEEDDLGGFLGLISPTLLKDGVYHAILIVDQSFIRKIKEHLMGRQINFYMSSDVQERFIVYLKESEFTFLNGKAQVIDDFFSDDILKTYFYKQVYGDIIMNQHSIINIDIIKSPIIEFKKTIFKKDQNKVLRGRLWINIQYYDERGTAINKGEQILKDYQRLVRWIKKNVPYQQIRKGEHYIKEYMNDELKELYDEGLTLTI